MPTDNPQPLNINDIKRAIKGAIPQKKITLKFDHSESAFTMALALTAAAKKTFYEKGEVKFSNEPVIEKKPIVSFKKSMRVNALDKFNRPTVFGVLHFYQDVQALEEHEAPIGVIISYIPKDRLAELLRLLKYPFLNDDEEEEVKDGAGTLVNLIAGHFKRELINLGYKDLEMSPFECYINSAPEGVLFPFSQLYRYELGFEIDGEKVLVMEVVMDDLPRKPKPKE